MKKLAIAACVTWIMSQSAVAQDAPKYNYVGVNYTSVFDTDFRFVDYEPDGWGINGSQRFGDNFMLKARYVSTSGTLHSGAFNSDADLTVWDAEVGYIYSLTAATDLNFALGYMRTDLEISNEESDDDAITTNLYLVSRLTDKLQVSTGLGWAFADKESDTLLASAGFSYDISTRFSITGDVFASDDIRLYQIGARYNF